MTEPRTIAESDLHAYVDGELDALTLTEIERWLAEHPEDAAKVHSFMLQKRLMHQVFDEGLDAPWPAGVEEMLTGEPRHAWWPGWTKIAATILLLVVGGATGWGFTTFSAQQAHAEKTFVESALNAHAVYSHDTQRPVEFTIDSGQEKLLLDWLSARVGEELMTPNLAGAGFALMGGRLVADKGMPAALLMYQDGNGKRVTLYCRKAFEDKDSTFKVISEHDMVAFYWTDGPLSYALTGEMPRGDLLYLAQMVYKDIDS